MGIWLSALMNYIMNAKWRNGEISKIIRLINSHHSPFLLFLYCIIRIIIKKEVDYLTCVHEDFIMVGI